ncbi:DHH family phosphoesterase [Oscillospiraceae bacterium CM]|nr:DHH family phosphoesterase [Oscillospiraceae bacterium CM]
MNKKMLDNYLPSMRLSLSLLLVFAVVTFFFGRYSLYLAIAEASVVLLLAVFIRFSSKKRSLKLLKYIESVTNSTASATKDTLLSFPLPVVIFSPETLTVLWSNNRFVQLTDSKERFFDVRLTDLIPDFSAKWLLDGKNECPQLMTVGDRRYKIFGSIIHTTHESDGVMAAAYWVDMTEYADRSDEYLASRPVCAIIMFDNYEELIKNMAEKDKSAILSAIDDKISAYLTGSNGVLCKYDRDRYLYLFEERYLHAFVEDKFSLLETVREAIKTGGGVHATLSIGIGKDGKTLEENFRYASVGIEMALSRGGDQAVIKNRFSFEFYGGLSTEVEKRTKVKSRVMANALGELISDASSVIVMSHARADLDSLGAAAGICCIARKRQKRAYIVSSADPSAVVDMTQQLREHPEYRGVFISAQDAMLFADSKTLLVIVDTNRPEQVESEALLLSMNHVAVIDHHRRAATYIENATLNFHEPYASSASELVAEMLQYLVEPSDILRVESEALLAGIVLDTKSFAIHTGSRTFDAAAYLRRSGADTTDVKRLLQSDFDTTMSKYAIIRGATMFKPGIALASSDVRENRVIVAQAADELLNIAGVQASFVVSPDGDDVFISARSIGNVNAQVIMEKLGGGGNQSTAGAKVTGMRQAEVLEQLKAAIDDYIDASAHTRLDENN